MRILFLAYFFVSFSFLAYGQSTTANTTAKTAIDQTLEAWHKAAADANFDAYFDKMTLDAVFIGTDATENWQNDAFRKFSKPYFDRGKAWSFTTLERNIYISEDGQYAWFDEHLDTQMGICRGSGILVNDNGLWKIKHYVLSIAIPNENVKDVTALKAKWDAAQMKKMRQ